MTSDDIWGPGCVKYCTNWPAKHFPGVYNVWPAPALRSKFTNGSWDRRILVFLTDFQLANYPTVGFSQPDWVHFYPLPKSMGHLLSKLYRICQFASQMESLKMTLEGFSWSLETQIRMAAFGVDVQSCDNDTQTPTTETWHWPPATAPTGFRAGPSNHLELLHPGPRVKAFDLQKLLGTRIFKRFQLRTVLLSMLKTATITKVFPTKFTSVLNPIINSNK